MPFHEHNVYVLPETYLSDSVIQAVFTRRGGASPSLASLILEDRWAMALPRGGSRIRIFGAPERDRASFHDKWLVQQTLSTLTRRAA